MNKQIYELAEQAGMERAGYANGTKIMTWREGFDNPGSLEKFAELIVRECGQYLMRNEFIGRSDLDWSMVLNEHFGVES